MRRSQMFPQRYLSAADVESYNPNGFLVTIYGIQSEVFGERGQEELVFFLRFTELKKPYRLNKTNADALYKEVPDSDDWIGKVVRITPFRTMINVKDENGMAIQKEVVTARLQFHHGSDRPVLPPGTDLTEYGYEVDSGRRRPLPGAAPRAALTSAPPPPPPQEDPEESIGKTKAETFMKHLRAVGKDWNAFLRFAYAKGQDVYAKAYGKEIADVPASLVPTMREYLASLGVKPASDVAHPASTLPPPPPVSGDVIDKATGEVISTKADSIPSEIAPLPKSEAPPASGIDVPF